jgi:hypothetical protein
MPISHISARTDSNNILFNWSSTGTINRILSRNNELYLHIMSTQGSVSLKSDFHCMCIFYKPTLVQIIQKSPRRVIQHPSPKCSESKQRTEVRNAWGNRFKASSLVCNATRACPRSGWPEGGVGDKRCWQTLVSVKLKANLVEDSFVDRQQDRAKLRHCDRIATTACGIVEVVCAV